jgi:serine/threonine protein kinase
MPVVIKLMQKEGTLGYLSPEQTGRINCAIDYRSDFYSLGVTFYELLTGQLPFKSNDSMELVHCHIAKQPDQVHQVNPQIPSVLSEIVGKLMAKNVEDRYQSALGLKRQRGYFIKGKYDQLQRNIPLRAFVQAFRNLMGQLLSESDSQLHTWKNNILAAVGENVLSM